MVNDERTDTVAGGWVYGSLPYGCQLCIKGRKIVYFMGGHCLRPSHCNWYCPISDERKPDSAHFADEIPIENPESLDDIVKTLVYESKKTQAYGMSLTGGDPLSTATKIDMTVNVIKAMKIEMGDEFDIHLYTSGKNFSVDIADRLDEAGLDSIRFHPEEKDFFNIEWAIGKSYTVGGEVPVVPTEENHEYLLRYADYLENIGADYLNLNEFEMCAPNQKALVEKKFELDDYGLAAVRGSRKYADKFFEDFKPKGTLSIHYCPVALKDGVQLRNRYRLRAETIKKPFETVSEDGSLIYLEIQGSVKELQTLQRYLIREARMPKKMMESNLANGILDLPAFLGEDRDFLALLADFKVKAGIVEMLPFREKKRQIRVEYTPIMNNFSIKNV
jgi:uncharacterized protein